MTPTDLLRLGPSWRASGFDPWPVDDRGMPLPIRLLAIVTMTVDELREAMNEPYAFDDDVDAARELMIEDFLRNLDDPRRLMPSDLDRRRLRTN